MTLVNTSSVNVVLTDLLYNTSQADSSTPFQTNSTLYENVSWNGTLSLDDSSQDKILIKIIISTITAILTLFTIAGNLLVIIAFKINKQLQNLSNYCLFSLAVSDLAVGIFLLPVYTLYVLLGHWPLGHVACNVWLSLDYALTTASVGNILVIAVDRHMSVSCPLAYRTKRTPRKMGCMIGSAWLISIFIWPPWIFAWPYIEGAVTVPDDECYVQFLKSNPLITTITSCVSFYIPVTVTTILYIILYRKTEQSRARMKAFVSSFVSARHKKRENIPGVNSGTVPGNSNEVSLMKCLKIQSLCCKCAAKQESPFGTGKKSRRYHYDIDADSPAGPKDGVDGIVLHSGKELNQNNIENTKTIDLNRNCHIHRNETCLKEVNIKCSSISKTLSEHNDLCPCDMINFHKNSLRVSSFAKASGCYDKTQHKQVHATDPFPDIIADLANKPLGSLNKTSHSHLVKNRQAGRHHDRKTARILSVILLALVVSFAPYYTVAMVEVYCDDCVSPVMHSIGRL